MRFSNGRSWSNERLRYIAKSLPTFENALNVSGNLDSGKEENFYRNYFKVKIIIYNVRDDYRIYLRNLNNYSYLNNLPLKD